MQNKENFNTKLANKFKPIMLLIWVLTSIFTGGNTGQAFYIDNATGVITTQTTLDHEQYAAYTLTVVAYNRADQNPHDQNYPLCDPMCQRPWEVLVYITVTDENDSPPHFEYSMYNVCKYSCSYCHICSA